MAVLHLLLRLSGQAGEGAAAPETAARSGHVLADVIGQSGFANLGAGNLVMYLIGGALIYLAVAKKYEPFLLIPIGFGAILANMPLGLLGADENGLLGMIYRTGIKTEFLPPIIFLGVGVLTDFRPLLGRPVTFLLGAAAQFGIYAAALLAFYLFGFTGREAAAIGIIGGADGPTSIFLASKMAPHLLGPIAVAAYSYMSLVPIIQPPVMRMLTTKKERAIDMPQARPVSRRALIWFPIVVTVVTILAIPSCAPLIGMLMFGNLLRVSKVTERLRQTAGGSLIDIATIFLGISVGATMGAQYFLTWSTISILILGAVAFAFSTAGGVLFGKALNLLLPDGKKINPCIGAAGVSAVPMSARVVQKVVSDDTDGRVNPLMAAMGPNVAGVIGSAAAAGMFLALMS